MKKLKNTKRKKDSEESSEKQEDILEFQGINTNILTLLQIEGRAPFPPIPSFGRPSTLVALAVEQPDAYSRLISLIRHGTSGNVAAESVGISQHTFYDWAKRGRKDSRFDELTGNPDLDETIVPLDTFYFRFFMDVRRAVATCTAECEIRIAQLTPRQWLANGPGRIFSDKWVDNPKASDQLEHNPQELILDSSKKVLSQESGDEGAVRVITVSEDDANDALQVLEDVGILKMSRQTKRELKKQAEDADTN